MAVAREEPLLYLGLTMGTCGAKGQEAPGTGGQTGRISLPSPSGHQSRNRDVTGYEVGYVVTPKSVKAAAPKGRMAAVLGSPCPVYSTNEQKKQEGWPRQAIRKLAAGWPCTTVPAGSGEATRSRHSRCSEQTHEASSAHLSGWLKTCCGLQKTGPPTC